ncbi:MAG: helicase-related protein, partial [Patescibacteria group bacterium]
EDKSDWRNAIDFTTDGKLVNWIVAGRISQYGFIIVDEAHEGSENIKTILRLLNDRMSLYPNLKVVILSATIDTEEFRRYFAGQGATIIKFEGKARFDSKGNEILPPVRHFAAEDERLAYEDPKLLVKPLMQKAREKAKWLVGEIVSGRKEWGDILIFLHGKNPIRQLVKEIQAWAQQDEDLSRIVEVYPLYRTENDEEDLTAVADENPKPGKIRIIVSTNIAEASVTIDSLVYEIETGVEIQPQFKAEIGASEYPMTLISRANATQRFGRVGRTKNGEVYTLYTEQQFNELFREQPLDVLERSNLEEILLKVKAAGIPNAQAGWLGNAPQEEIDRSTKQLIDSNLLTEDGLLTSYGALVRIFSYPPRLIDMLMSADDLGCSVEMATILPVIKNDGNHRLLSWKFNWDAYTKRTAFKRHSALMAGCKDDVEFILKLYKAWDELPCLDQNRLRELSKEELNTLRKQWADIHFVNHKVMLAIAKDRDEALVRLGVSTKEEGARPISLSQINRARALLRSMLTEAEVITATNPYRYAADIEPEAGTLAVCSLIADEQSALKDSWLEAPKREDVADRIFSRLFIDQVYPVGYRFAAKIEQQTEEFAWVKTTSNPTRIKALAQQTVNLVNEEEEFEDAFEDEISEAEEPVKARGIMLDDISIWYGTIDCRQAVRTASPVGGEIVVEVTGFYFEVGQSPVVIAEIVPQPEPFDIFVGRYRLGDEVAGVVTNILVYRNDRNATFIVRDSKTNLEVLVEPIDLGFKSSALAVKEIPPGTQLKLYVESINVESRRVSLSNRKRTGAVVSNAVVLEINTGGVVIDLGQGLRGFAPRSQIMGGNSKLFGLIKVGLPLNVRVLKHDADRAEPLLEVTGGIEDPIKQFEVGKTYNGVVDNINQNGIFVVLAPSVVGRVRHDETYFGRYKAEGFIKPGGKVNVKVLSINQAERRLDLSMKLPEHDPTTKIQVGMSCQGTITSITQLGAFVELAPALVGLLRTQNFPQTSGFLGLGGRPKIETGMRLVVRVASILPNRRDPTRKDVNLEYVRHVK